MGKGKKDIEIDLSLTSGMPDQGVEGESAPGTPREVRSRRQILATREKSGTQKALYVTISSQTYKRVRTFAVLNTGEGEGKLTLSSITEAALVEYLDRHDKL